MDSEHDGASPTILDARPARVGGVTVARLMPQRARRTVGAWCFLDHLTQASASPLSVGPHPHIGLQTVTWLFAGEVRHTDSLGNAATIRPGQLNLMSAGRGVAHAEQELSSTNVGAHGVQLWIAQPDATRRGPADFLHVPELPSIDVGAVRATVLLGSFAEVTSPAVAATPLVGVEIVGSGPIRVPLEPHFEHVVAVLAGRATVAGASAATNQLADLGSGVTSADVDLGDGARLLLLGGTPLDEPPLMWWNFVARDREEIDEALRAWQEHDQRFGDVSSPFARIEAPVPPWQPNRRRDAR